MRWALERLNVASMLPDASLPTWITATESYQRGLFEFDEPSQSIVLRVAYYMGECFVRNFSCLVWSVGDAGSALQNMPVVTGFDHRIEMAPVLIANNLFRRVLHGSGNEHTFNVAVDRWL
jgi:hypothetical protein